MIRASTSPVTLLLAILALASQLAISAELEDSGPVSSTTRFIIRSEVLNESRKVFVYLPDTYALDTARESRYPVLYLLDGLAYFDATIGIAHHLGSINAAVQRIPDLIVVAIANTKRSRDMTPTRMAEGPYSSGSGGAASFRKFLESELIPAVDKRFRTSGERVLVGHSLAGLFVLDTFLEEPDLFRAYIASDPSLWWDDKLLTRKLSARRGTLSGSSVRVFIAQANTPDSTPGEHDAHKAGIAEFRAALERAKSSASSSYLYFEDETHMSVPLQAIYRGLLFVYEGHGNPTRASTSSTSDKSPERTRER